MKNEADYHLYIAAFIARHYDALTPVPIGVTVPVEICLHYNVNADGKIWPIKGAVGLPEAPSAP